MEEERERLNEGGGKKKERGRGERKVGGMNKETVGTAMDQPAGGWHERARREEKIEKKRSRPADPQFYTGCA